MSFKSPTRGSGAHRPAGWTSFCSLGCVHCCAPTTLVRLLCQFEAGILGGILRWALILDTLCSFLFLFYSFANFELSCLRQLEHNLKACAQTSCVALEAGMQQEGVEKVAGRTEKREGHKRRRLVSSGCVLVFLQVFASSLISHCRSLKRLRSTCWFVQTVLSVI